MAKNKFYITTPIYYVNDVPHAGHAYTTLAADVLARYWRGKLGEKNVFFLTGTDEHGQKVQQAAEKKGLSPKKFADSVAPRFQKAWKLLNIRYDYFIRTTDPRHEKVVKELLQKIYDAGYIYEGTYKGLYCVGCEKFLTESELADGKCPLHPNKQPVYQEEENYFLKLKELSKLVLEKIEKGEYKILPKKREHEVVSRLNRGVEDVSISRASVAWGIPIPWDKKQTAYVWIDALINYYSATQILKDKKSFWPANLHLIGKDILWFHTVIWQALLLASGVKLPETIFAHGYFTVGGQKMSKSLGNVISPEQLVDRYGVGGARYLLISAIKFGSDGDVTLKRFDEKFNADLANGIGNLVARIAKLAELNALDLGKIKIDRPNRILSETESLIENFRLDKALEYIWGAIGGLDKYIDRHELWNKEANEVNKRLKEIIVGSESVTSILEITEALKPFLPETAEKIEKQFKGPKIKSGKPLFPRLS
ncbi:methionine--tRNA ligase [Patescibacteria group bacterium]|nr:methionine--tRNA ligase [Patescibacteria group bacterium]